MSTKTKDLSSRIQTLQERLDEENKTRDRVELPPFSSPQLGSGRRPSNCEYLHSPVRNTSNCDCMRFQWDLSPRTIFSYENGQWKKVKWNAAIGRFEAMMKRQNCSRQSIVFDFNRHSFSIQFSISFCEDFA